MVLFLMGKVVPEHSLAGEIVWLELFERRLRLLRDDDAVLIYFDVIRHETLIIVRITIRHPIYIYYCKTLTY